MFIVKINFVTMAAIKFFVVFVIVTNIFYMLPMITEMIPFQQQQLLGFLLKKNIYP